jgi:hypothetical protein
MIDLQQIEAAGLILEKGLKDDSREADATVKEAACTLLIATVQSLASIANSLEVIAVEHRRIKE